MKTTIEALATLFLIVVILLAPIAIGLLIYKVYRTIVPAKEIEVNSILDIDKVGDRFFIKSLIIGWTICAPIYYWFYTTQTF